MNLTALMLGTIFSATSAPLAAQDRAGSDKDAQIYLAEFADCVVRQKGYRAKVDTFLRQVPGTEAFGAAGLAAADLSCLNDAASRARSKITMRMQPAIFRDALYPALYKRDFGKTGPVAAAATVPPLDLATEFDGPITASAEEYRPLRALGDCVARAAPGGAHQLLTAKPFDKQENLAVGQLRPAIAACLAPGQTLRFNRAALRATIGEAMYKLARATATAPVAG